MPKDIIFSFDILHAWNLYLTYAIWYQEAKYNLLHNFSKILNIAHCPKHYGKMNYRSYGLGILYLAEALGRVSMHQ